MADGVATRLRASGLGARTISLKVRDATFATLTRSRTLPRGVDTAAAIIDVVVPLMDQVEPTGGVRLLGVVASKFAAPSEQLQLDGFAGDGDVAEQWSEASAAIDRVRGRFGTAAIGPASALSSRRSENCPPRATAMGYKRAERLRNRPKRPPPGLRWRSERGRMRSRHRARQPARPAGELGRTRCHSLRTNSGSSARSSSSSNGTRRSRPAATSCPDAVSCCSRWRWSRRWRSPCCCSASPCGCRSPGSSASLALAVVLEREVRLVARERIAALPLSAWLGANSRRRPGAPGEHGPTTSENLETNPNPSERRMAADVLGQR